MAACLHYSWKLRSLPPSISMKRPSQKPISLKSDFGYYCIKLKPDSPFVCLISISLRPALNFLFRLLDFDT